jgi:NADH-quinone oxidoreductase subunit M
MQNQIGLISYTLLVPLLGALFLMCVPQQYEKAIKVFGFAFSAVAFVMSLAVLRQFSGGTYHFQMVELVPWIPSLGINYKVGLDGISIWLFVLTTLLTSLSLLFSFYVSKRVKTYFIMILLLEAAMLGVFVAMDLILFYAFFEFSLIPMAIMVYIWGGENRTYAAIKFFIYTFAASIFLLLGMIVVAKRAELVSGQITFDLVALQNLVASGQLWGNELGLQILIFWSFTLAFLVKCPSFPFHTWLPDAHTEAPTAGSMILAGVLLKMGTYGLLRMSLPLFPEAAQVATPVIMVLAVVGIIYGALVAAVQTDIKKLVAYSSVAHMGFVLYGIFSLNHTGMMGGAYQQLNHGISTGALFLLIGLLYERIHTRKFSDMGGLKQQMPVFSALFLIIMLSSIGLPGLNGFVGEFMALLGGFQSAYAGAFGLNIVLALIAGFGVVVGAVYLLLMFMKTFYGPVNPNLTRLKDLKPWEVGLVGVFVIFAFWGGLYPNTFLQPMDRAVNATRMMVVNPPGLRPTWSDPDLEIDAKGALVRVQFRRADGSIDENGPVEPVFSTPLFGPPPLNPLLSAAKEQANP